MKQFTLLVAIAFSLLWGITSAEAAAPRVAVSATLSGGGTLLSVSVQPKSDLSSCSVTLYASASKSALKKAFSGATALAAFSTLSAAQTLQANNLAIPFSAKRRPKSKSAYFRAVATCAGRALLSKTASVKVPASAQGTLASVAAWVAQLPGSLALPAVEITRAQAQLSFSSPVDLQHAGDNRLFVVEQAGIIKVFPNVPGATASVFLDIRSKVKSGGEQGLLSMAFHPNYQSNGVFFVHYSEKTNGNTTIARYHVSGTNRDAADPASEEILLSVQQPFSNHNGGQIAFGPDGYLYIGLGDGGSGGDPLHNGQDKTTLLGKILRIDVNSAQPPLAYAIPPTNPFAGNASGFRQEIYAVGMRNPWKMSFDSSTLWVGDVGQGDREEVDIVTSGSNYGWNTMEGDACYPPGTSHCDQTGLTLPVVDYTHSEGNSITGGYVYRGAQATPLSGKYLYADFVSGKIWALALVGGSGQTSLLFDTSYSISSFGRDVSGELYFFDYGSGALYTFIAR